MAQFRGSAALRLPDPVEWSWVFRPSYNPDNNTTVGYLRIGSTIYCVREVIFTHPDESGGRLWQLTKGDDTQYQACVNPATGDLECDCPDATYRERPCKHVMAVQAAYGLIDTLVAIASAVPADCPF